MTIEHSTISFGEMHPAANWVLTSGGAAALGGIAVSDADIGKVAWVAGVGHYALAAIEPTVWESVGTTMTGAEFASQTLTLTFSDDSTVDVEIPSVSPADMEDYVEDALSDYVTGSTLETALADKQDMELTGGKQAKILSGAIRNSGAGLSFISDASHGTLFFTGTPYILPAPEDFKVTLSHPTGASKVGTLICAPDETLAPYGVQIGGSVGTDSSTIRAGMPLRFRTYGTTAVADFHPFFGSRVSIAALGDGTGFTITTPQLQNGTATTMPIVGSTHYIDGRADDIQIKSLSLTQFEVRAVGDIDGYLAYNGSEWVFTTDTVASLSASWSVDTLTITHNSSGIANLSAFLQQVYGGYRPVLVASNAISFSVKFVNDAGTVQTALSTAFKFRFMRPHKMPKLMQATQTCYFDCGMALLYWGDIISVNGNIWLHGIMYNG